MNGIVTQPWLGNGAEYEPHHEIPCEHCHGSGVVIVDLGPGYGPGGVDCGLCGGCGSELVPAHPTGQAHA
jgi:RecJ-like exonuclease